MRKWTLRFWLGLLILVVSLPTFVWLLNSIDEPVRPEVQRVLSKSPKFSERQKQAYYYALGLSAGEKVDPEKRGAELWVTHTTPGFWTRTLKRDLKIWEIDFHGCPQGHCTVQAFNEHPELAEALKTYHEVLQNYIHLMEYGEGADLFESSRETFFPPLRLVQLNVHRLFLVQLAQWLKQGGEERVMDLLTLSNHAMQGYFQSGTFLECMMAAVILKENAEFVTSALTVDRKLRVTQDFVDSLTMPDAHEILYNAADFETRIFNNVVHSLKTLNQLELSSLGPDEESGRNFSRWVPISPGLRPNETLNMYYEISQQALSSDCPMLDMATCVPAMQWTSFANPWHYFSNPLGRRVTWIMGVQYAGLREKLRNRGQELGRLREELTQHL